MKIIICDDQIKEIEKAKSLCEEYFDLRGLDGEIVMETSPLRLLEMEMDADVLILDVEMKEMDGIEVKDRLAMRGDSPLIIFATSHPEAMSSAFNVNVIGFLMKPLNFDGFCGYMDSAISHLTADKPFVFDDGTKGSTGDIFWIKADKGYSDILLVDGTKKSAGRKTISQLEEALESFGFMRIDVGQIVNCKYVKDFDNAKGLIVVRDVRERPKDEPKDVILAVSRRRRKECWEKYLAYCNRMQKYV